MLRWFGVSVLLLVSVSALAAGCGNGVSDSTAQTYCQQEQAAVGDCFGADSFDQCITCYEACGSNCTAGGCPQTFVCPQ